MADISKFEGGRNAVDQYHILAEVLLKKLSFSEDTYRTMSVEERREKGSLF